MKRTTQTHIHFGFRADKIVPDEVTAALQMIPTRSCAKGDKFKNVSGVHSRSSGIWALNTEHLVRSDELEKHAIYLLERLEPKRDNLRRFLDDETVTISLNLVVVGATWGGGDSLPSAILSRLCALCNRVDFSYVPVDEEEDEAGETHNNSSITSRSG